MKRAFAVALFAMNRAKYLIFVGLLAAAACDNPLPPAQQPVLVVPTIHTSHIKYLSITPGLPYLATTSEDAVKIWETRSGKLIRTIPAPKDKGFAAAAISSDLKWLATAGNIYERDMRPTVAPSLQLWDPLTGAHIRQLHAFALGEQVVDLRFNPHQRYLMAVVYGGGGLSTVLFDPATGEKHLSLPGFGSFSQSGEHVVLRQANSVVLAGIADGAMQTVLAEPCLLAHAAGGAVYLLTKTGRLVQWSMASQSIVGDHALSINSRILDILDQYIDWKRAQFSLDGKRLIVCDLDAAQADDEDLAAYRFNVFDTADGRQLNGVSAQTSFDDRWGIYTPDLAYFLTAPIVAENADNRSIVDAYSTSTGAFAHTFGVQAFEATTMANKFLDSDLNISAYDRGELIVVRGRAFEGPAAVFNTKTGQSISIEEEALDAYLEKNKCVKDERWRVVCDDFLSYQIIDTRTSNTVATLLFSESSEEDHSNTTQTWAVTTPSGLFDASPDMMQYLHYVAGMEIIELDQLKERYYEPGLLSKLLGLNQDPLRSVEAFSAVPLYPEMTAQVSEDRLKLLVQLTARNGGIGKLSLFVNGKEVTEDANPQRTDALNIDLTEYADYYLPGETNILALRAYNQAGWLKSAALELDYRPPATARGGTSAAPSPTPTATISRPRPALYALVVGTAKYAGDKLSLQFSDRDAAYFSQALRAASPKVFGDRVSVTLLNTDAEEKTRQDVSSKTNIQKAFADIASKAKAQDVLVIYFSGHGVNYGAAENAQFYYLTKDIASENLSDPEIRNNYAISSAELTEWIKAIPALKQVMVIDACNAGKIVEDLAVRKDLNSTQVRALDRMKDRTGMFILTGSAADKVSYEAGQYGQGLLTYSLLQGMSGLALTEDKRVDVMTLFQYSRDKVPDLAKGIGGVQTPVLAFPLNGASFDIGIVDASVKIPIAQVKPVFIRNNFSDDDTFDDGLGLTQALADNFRRLTVKGAQAELIFVDVNEYENAYSIKGRYKVSGDAVTVRARLFKGKTVVGSEFTLTGKKSDVPALVEEIAGKVARMVK